MNKHYIFISLLFSLLSLNLSATNSLSVSWANPIGGSGGEQGKSIIADNNGNIYTTGYFEGTVDFDPGVGVSSLTSTGYFDVFITKYGIQGNFIWAKKIGGVNYDEANTLALDIAGNILIGGYFNSTVDFNPSATVTNNLVSSGGADIFIAKYDPNGNYIWAKKMGGAYEDNANSIAVDASGNIITTGTFASTVDFNPGTAVLNLTSSGGGDIFVQKLTSNGDFIWAKKIGGANNDEASIVKIGANNSIYTAGYFTLTVDFDPGTVVNNLVTTGGNDAFVSKLDSNGNYFWAKKIGGTSNDEIRAMDLDQNNNVVVLGEFQATINFNPTGANESLTALAGGIDLFVNKMNSDGQFIWVKKFGGNAYDQGIALACDFSGDVYIGGSFQGTADFDPGIAVVNLVAGTSNGFVCKLSQAGIYDWAKNIQSTSYSAIFDLTLDSYKNVYTTGTFFGAVNFDPLNSTSTAPSIGSSDFYVQKIRQCLVLPNVVISSNANDACPGQTITLTATGNAQQYSWSNGINNGLSFSPSATETYTVTATDVSGCTNTATKLITVHPCVVNLNLHFFLQGLMNSPTTMSSGLLNSGIGNSGLEVDSVTIQLAEAIAPYNVVSQATTVLNTNGIVTSTMPYVSGLHYIIVKHRNSLETWTANPINITDNLTYDFSTSGMSSFGNNQIEMFPNVFAIYSGDINQDGIIDNYDYSNWEASSNNFESGYLVSDLDGSGSSDNNDYTFWEQNSNAFIGVIKP